MLLQMVISALLLGGIYVLMALGLSLGFGITNILNFAYGEAVMLGAYAAFWAFRLWGVDPLWSIPATLVLGFVAGWVLFRQLIERVLQAPQLNQILVTFGIGLILQNAALIAFGGDLRSANPDYALQSFSLGDAYVSLGRLIACGVAALLSAGLLVWLFKTEHGRACRAIAQNEMAASLVGIDTRALHAVAFGVSVGLAAATGATLSVVTSVTPFIGLPLLVKALAIIVLGGMGSIWGTIVGGLVLGALETGVAYLVPNGSGWAEGVSYLMLLLVLVVRPSGIAGRRVGEA